MSEIDAVVRCILEAEQSSNDGKEVTPVPMSNTEVKLFSANGSWGLSPCESRTLLGTLKTQLFIQLCFFRIFRNGIYCLLIWLYLLMIIVFVEYILIILFL